MTDACSKRVRSGKAPGSACLKAAAAHIAHDVEMLTLAWAKRNTRLGWTLWFMLARSLADFLFVYQRKAVDKDKKAYLDDILAADYLDDGRWQAAARELEKEKPPETAKVRKAANKLAAHLTYDRLDGEAWDGHAPPEPVHRFLLGAFQVWIAELPPERRAWFGAL